MKRLLTLLMALLLLGTGAALAEGSNPFLGQWNGVAANLMGLDFTIEELGWNEFGLVVEQDVAYLNIDGEQGACPTRYEGDTLIFTNGDEAVFCTLEGGLLYMKMNVDGMDVTFCLERVGSGEAATFVVPGAAQSNPFLGEWVGKSVNLLGMDFTIADLGWSEFGLVVEQDEACLIIDGEQDTCPARYEGDTLIFTNGDEAVFCTLEGGLLYMKMNVDGMDVTFCLERVGSAAAPAPIVVTDFAGLWTLAEVKQNGTEQSAEALGLSGSIRVMGESARYTLGDESHLAIVKTGEGWMRLTSGGGVYEFAADAMGRLCCDMPVDGGAVTLIFVREGAAAPVPVEIVLSDCDFCGKEYEGQGHDVEGMTVCPTCFTRFFK